MTEEIAAAAAEQEVEGVAAADATNDATEQPQGFVPQPMSAENFVTVVWFHARVKETGQSELRRVYLGGLMGLRKAAHIEEIERMIVANSNGEIDAAFVTDWKILEK